ncbi:hypothetical protein QYE76_003829 [Lolium multiflorum]|uniref:Transposase (putative) gypsy type domain-containing protein n=1 Tax=Lolium multiflorum TaxID=4521 RepID=A0AAD8RQX5_LOLMU|nr:hypothetical protein QYE76_003829 [Lolium multiflorum]
MHPTVRPFSFRRRIRNANLRARSINTPPRGNSSFVSPHYHFIFLLPPRRPPDFNSDELRRRGLHARSLQASPRSKIAAVDREISRRRFVVTRVVSASPATLILAGASPVRRAIDAGSMPIDSHCTGSSPNSPDPSSLEPICPDPIAYLPPFVSDIRLAQPFSASSSIKLGRIPTAQELEEELQGQARMAAKVQETENKKASKARIREGERGQWWPCETTDTELRELQNEGMISAHWSFIRDTVVPKPGAGEVVMTKAWVERGLSLPCSEFFLSVLNTYGLQPHNICPNSYLLLSNFATLCEGHLGIRPDVKLWQFFFRVKKETKDKAMLNCGSMTFMLRPGRMYPPHDSHESVRYWNAGWFYEKNVSVPEIHDGLPKFNNEPPEELASWSFIPSLSLTPILEKAARRISWLVHDGLTGTQLTLSWFTRRIQPLRYNARLICAYTGADDQLRATRHDLPADSLKRRFKTLVKLATLAEENLRTILRVPVSGDTAEEVPEDEEEEEEQAPRKNSDYRCHSDRQPRAHHKVHEEISGCWSYNPSSAKRFPHCSTAISSSGGTISPSCRKHSTGNNSGASSSLATTSSELENLRSSYQELEIKLKEAEAEQRKEHAEKQLAEKNSELIREKGEFVLKCNADSETIKRQQKELNGLRKYMETAEHHWDLLAENILEPLGYSERRRNKFPRDDVLSLAGDDCKDLISASRKICHNLSLKKSRTCGLRKLVKRMDILPELVTDLQASSARGAAAMTLTMCLAHNPEMDLDRVTSGVPPTADVGALLDAVSGYDTRIARRIRHDEFYDKVVLPADEPLEEELLKERDAEARPAESGTQFTWTSSKDAPQEEPKPSAATSEEDEESDEDVSSPAEGAKGKDPEGTASPSKAE